MHGRTGWAVEGDSGADIAAAVRRVCGDADLRAAIARNGRRTAVSDFSLSAMIQRIERLYFAVVERKQAGRRAAVAAPALEAAAKGSRRAGRR